MPITYLLELENYMGCSLMTHQIKNFSHPLSHSSKNNQLISDRSSCASVLFQNNSITLKLAFKKHPKSRQVYENIAQASSPGELTVLVWLEWPGKIILLPGAVLDVPIGRARHDSHFLSQFWMIICLQKLQPQFWLHLFAALVNILLAMIVNSIRSISTI